MLNETEKRFLKSFSIKPIYYQYLLVDKSTRKLNEKLLSREAFIDFVRSGKPYILLGVDKKYPKFTADRMLALYCIICKVAHGIDASILIDACDVERLRHQILTKLTLHQELMQDYEKYQLLNVPKLVQEVFNEN